MISRNRFLAAGSAAATITTTAFAIQRLKIAGTSDRDVSTDVRILVGAALIIIFIAAVTGYFWRSHDSSEMLPVSFVGAGCVGFTVLLMSNSIAGSTSCPGTQDCDTSFGLGAGLIAGVFFVPILAAAFAGRGLRLLRERSAE